MYFAVEKDYLPVSVNLTFDGNHLSQCTNITIINDNEVEAREQIMLALFEDGDIIHTTNITILDDDCEFSDCKVK